MDTGIGHVAKIDKDDCGENGIEWSMLVDSGQEITYVASPIGL